MNPKWQTGGINAEFPPAALKALTTLAKHQTQPKPAIEPFYFEYFSP